MSTSGIFLPPLKNLQRDQELCKSCTNCVAPGPKRVRRKTGSTQDHGQAAQDQAQQDVSRRPPLHTCLARSFSGGINKDLRRNVGIPEEVQPGQRRTTNCVSDLGQVTLKGNAQTEDPLKDKKYNGSLSSCGVGAHRCLGRSPASFWVGHLAGGARTFAPLFGSLLSSRETAHGVSLSCLPAMSAGSLASYAFGAPAESPCCGVERRAQLHLTERSIAGTRTRDHRSHCGFPFPTLPSC